MTTIIVRDDYHYQALHPEAQWKLLTVEGYGLTIPREGDIVKLSHKLEEGAEERTFVGKVIRVTVEYRQVGSNPGQTIVWVDV